MDHGLPENRQTAGRRGVAFLTGLFLILFPLLLLAEPTRFAVVTDTHVGSSDSVYPAFIRIMEDRKIEVIFHTGDAIDTPGSVRQWKKFLEITGPGKTLYLTPGNHDIHGPRSFAAYLKFFPKPYYSVSDGDTLFVLLNTELPGEESRVTGDQFEWLKGELERPFRYKFVFLHEPLFPLVSGHALDRHKEARDRLHGLLVRKKVDLVVSGHDHLYFRRERDGITYIIGAAAGGNLNHFPKDSDFFRYIVATRKNGGYEFVVKDLGGGTRDEFVVER